MSNNTNKSLYNNPESSAFHIKPKESGFKKSSLNKGKSNCVKNNHDVHPIHKKLDKISNIFRKRILLNSLIYIYIYIYIYI